MASTYLTRTPSSSGNRRTMTFSFWVKRSSLGNNALYGQYNSTNDNNSNIYFTSADKLIFWDYTSPSYNMNFNTNRLFRDTNAWYHIVIAIDTTQATASNRVKFYINGVQETSLSPETYPSQNRELFLNENKAQHIGNFRYGSTDEYIFNGLMSHFHFIDGTAYDATAFGEFDANGVWKIKTEPSVTYGTNGYFILQDGNSVTDQSGNGNNWSVAAGTLTNTEDNPSNVFCTMNPLDKSYSGTAVLSDGNTTVTGDGTWQNMRLGTIGANSGKWYWEMKINSGNNVNMHFGIVPETWNMNYSSNYYQQTGYYGYQINDYKYDNASGSSGSGTYTNGQIVGLALDLDSASKTLSIYYNNSQVAGSILTLSSTFDGQFWRPFFLGNNSSATAIGYFNFGNGYFGTTAVASAGTNASGNGIFEYDVPTGYTALSTRGLNL